MKQLTPIPSALTADLQTPWGYYARSSPVTVMARVKGGNVLVCMDNGHHINHKHPTRTRETIGGLCHCITTNATNVRPIKAQRITA